MSAASVGQGLQFLLFTAGAFVLMALVYSVWKFEQLSRVARRPEDRPLEPGEALLLRVAARMGVGRPGGSVFSVLVAEASRKGSGSPVPAGELADLLSGQIRSDVDEILELGASRLGLLMHCHPAHIPAIHGRWARHAGAVCIRAGLAGYPDTATGAEGLVFAAEEALREAPQGEAGGVGRRPAGLGDALPEAEDSDGAENDERILDPLTGVLRPERVGAAALKSMARWRREGRRVALVVLDFDELASVNERHGREAGDEALRGMGRLLHSAVRESDLIGRLGEDEFIVLAVGNGEDALRIGRRVLNAYARAASRPGAGARMHGTVSAGTAEAPRDAKEFPALLHGARLALERGRRMGRGRCTRYEPTREKTRTPAGAEMLHDRF